uniref:uncharacterized protein LOC120347225 n=1 Tax=Styela clava TaxID=7725 RepID=UPI001939E431|nr:uncharacterized protein LOC120347225 [Styela clava]
MTRSRTSSFRTGSVRSIMPVTTSSSIFGRSMFEKFVPKQPKKKIKTFYDNWAEHYDCDMLDMGYRLHDVATTILMENMENCTDDDCFVIDFGSGTGLIGNKLRKKDFNGILHGVDESRSMLEMANRKHVYDDLYQQHLAVNEKIDITENLLYDGLSCVASFGTEHIHPKMFPDFVNLVKGDGVLVFTAPNHPRDETDKVELESEIKKLVEKETIRKISETTECYFTQGRTSRESHMAATCQLYCYKKNPDNTQFTKF